MSPRSLLFVTFLPLVAGCEATAPAHSGEPTTAVVELAARGDAPQEPKADGKADGKDKADEKKQQAKELRTKRRELDYAHVEEQTAALDAEVRSLSTSAELTKTAAALEQARRELAVFVEQVKPRELESHRISLDRATYSADHEKDELGELVAMYEHDEFAKTTKELVLKRGRRGAEIAARELVVEQMEFSHFEREAMPQRERELRQKVADGELDRKKAENEAAKAKLELELAARKLRERIADLEEDIAELTAKVAAEKS